MIIEILILLKKLSSPNKLRGILLWSFTFIIWFINNFKSTQNNLLIFLSCISRILEIDSLKRESRAKPILFYIIKYGYVIRVFPTYYTSTRIIRVPKNKIRVCGKKYICSHSSIMETNKGFDLIKNLIKADWPASHWRGTTDPCASAVDSNDSGYWTLMVSRSTLHNCAIADSLQVAEISFATRKIIFLLNN